MLEPRVEARITRDLPERARYELALPGGEVAALAAWMVVSLLALWGLLLAGAAALALAACAHPSSQCTHEWLSHIGRNCTYRL